MGGMVKFIVDVEVLITDEFIPTAGNVARRSHKSQQKRPNNRHNGQEPFHNLRAHNQFCSDASRGTGRRLHCNGTSPAYAPLIRRRTAPTPLQLVPSRRVAEKMLTKN